MHQPKPEAFQAVSERNWLERLYYHHGFYCANHPAFVIFICGVLIFLCSAPIISFLPFAVTIPSEWNETVLNDVSTDHKPNWVKDTPVAYIQQVLVAVVVQPVNASLVMPYAIHEAFQPVFKIVNDIYEHQERNGTKISDLCFLIRHRDSFSGGRKFLPKKGCLLISPANLWQDATSFQEDMDIMEKIYGKHSKNSVSIKENIFGVPLHAIGLFPLNVTKECLVIRYAVTAVLQKYNPSYIKGLRKLLLKNFSPTVKAIKAKDSRDLQPIVHIHYEGDNIIEIYHLCFTYFLVFIYLVFSVSKIDMVKSKLGLAFSAVVTVVASLSMAAGLCIFFGMVPSVSSSEIFPYLVIIIGLENILVITRSIVSTPAYLPVPLRVAEGLSREGRSITLNLMTELLLLFCGYCTFVPAVQEFCMVGGVGVLTDFFLQIVFFATVLSIDLSRLEPRAKHKSTQVEIDVYNSTVKQSKKIDPGQSRTWKDLLVSLFNPRKIFTIRQDLPKRLNFAYFWARTRIVQRGCMLCAILYIVYVTSSSLINKGQETLPNITQELNGSVDRVLIKNNSSMSTPIPSSSISTSRFVEQKHFVHPSNSERKPLHREKGSNSSKSEKCRDDMNSEDLWRNLSRHHWPELLDMYGVNVIDRYISVLPPISIQYEVNMLNVKNAVPHVSQNVSEFYEDFSKDSRWTSRSYTVKFELVDFVKVLYLFTGIFVIVSYLVYLLFTALLRHRKRRRVKDKIKTVVPVTSPIFLDGHEQNIECIDCDNNIITSSCLQGCVRAWDSKTLECISDIKRDRRPSQVWSLNCWDNCIAVGCSNGDVEIWDISNERLIFLYANCSCGVTSVLYVPESKVLVLSRLDGVLEFIELGNRLARSNNILNSQNNSLSSNIKKKHHLNSSSWDTITNNVLRDSYPCYSCRAHRKTINVLKTCKDLVISASCDHLLKVYRSHTGLCVFTFRGHTSAVTALHVDEPEQGAISGSFDGELRRWSLISGDCKMFSTGHLCSVIAIVCTGKRIVSLDISELLCIWDQPTRNCLHRISQLPGGCHNLTLISTNLAVCVGRGTMVMLDLNSGQILRIVELEQKNDHVLMNHVISPCQDTVVCDYGERLVLLTFLEIVDKRE